MAGAGIEFAIIRRDRQQARRRSIDSRTPVRSFATIAGVTVYIGRIVVVESRARNKVREGEGAFASARGACAPERVMRRSDPATESKTPLLVFK